MDVRLSEFARAIVRAALGGSDISEFGISVQSRTKASQVLPLSFGHRGRRRISAILRVVEFE